VIGRLRFRLWIVRLRLELRRRGGSLHLDAPDGARLEGPAHVDLPPAGARLTLRLGRGVSLGRQLTLVAAGRGELSLGDGVSLQHAVRIELRDGGSIAVGAGSHVRDGTVLKASGALRIGREVTLGFHDVLSCAERIEIGDRAGLGERVSVTDSDHSPDGTDAHYLYAPLRTTPVRVGPNVLVSAGVTILRGAVLGANAAVAAGAVVRGGEHAGGWLHAGVPARAVRALARSRPPR